jgi:hypothetical protein
MAPPTNTERRRRWPVVARRRAIRLRDVERRLTARLDELYRCDRRGYDALLGLLGRVLSHESRRGR